MSYNKALMSEFLRDCNKVTERYEKLWGRWNVDSQLLHIITEVCELKDVIRNKSEKYGKYGSSQHLVHLKYELADIFLTACATANYLGISEELLNSAILEKLAEVQVRVEDAEKRTEQFAKQAIQQAETKSGESEKEQ